VKNTVELLTVQFSVVIDKTRGSPSADVPSPDERRRHNTKQCGRNSSSWQRSNDQRPTSTEHRLIVTWVDVYAHRVIITSAVQRHFLTHIDIIDNRNTLSNIGYKSYIVYVENSADCSDVNINV